MEIIHRYLGENWEPISPFYRATKKRPVEDYLKVGEKEYDVCDELVHIVEWNGEPPKMVKLNLTEIEEFKKDPEKFKKDNRVQYREKCFLWIIDQNSLKIAREKIRNEKRAHDSDYICHTNLSNCGLAYIGGEMLFGEDGNIYLNFFSDRYGNPSQELWEATKKVFVELGYVNIVDILELINKK